MKYLLPIILLTGCAEIKMPTPISFPSVCLGDEHCERNQNARTLAQMGFADAALDIMCNDRRLSERLAMECGQQLQY